MKRTTIVLFLFSLTFQVLSAQTEQLPAEVSASKEDTPYEMFDIEKEPSFPGGLEPMYRYLNSHTKYPKSAIRKSIQGTVILTFVVEKNGTITNIKIVEDIGGGCGKQVVRAIKSMPRWTPGEANGQPVKVHYTLPFKFKLV